MVLLITYDLKQPGRNYDALYEAIKTLGQWWHFLDSTWLVQTAMTPDQVAARLRLHMDANDYLLVVKVTRPYQGWLPKDAWEWVNSRIGF
ncbi:MAG: hypothetical protein NTX53_21170 [candidate division WOR-3 bacterium]|nr:hypothetical protein [candidate division WOR-3 bacterium]